MQRGKKCGENRIDLYNDPLFSPNESRKSKNRETRLGNLGRVAALKAERRDLRGVTSVLEIAGSATCREPTRPELKTAPSEALEGNVSTSEQRVASPHAEKTYTALQDTEADLLQLRTLGSDHIYTTSRPRRLCRRASSSGGPQRSCFRPGTKKPPLRSH